MGHAGSRPRRPGRQTQTEEGGGGQLHEQWPAGVRWPGWQYISGSNFGRAWPGLPLLLMLLGFLDTSRVPRHAHSSFEKTSRVSRAKRRARRGQRSAA